jgi:hypothetical protein
MQALDYNTHVYLAVTLSTTSPYIHAPSALENVHPSIAHMGQVGQMQDVQLLRVSKQNWNGMQDEILGSLRQEVIRVDVQEPRTRVKRGGEGL